MKRVIDWWEDQFTTTKRTLSLLALLVAVSICGTLVASCAVAPPPTPSSQRPPATPTRILPQLTGAVLPASKTAAQASFEQIGFTFDAAEVLENPDLRITRGKHPDVELESVVLFEIPAGLASALHTGSTIGTPDELGMRNVHRLWLLWTILPEWEGADVWLSDSLPTVRRQGPSTLLVGSTLVELEYNHVIFDDGIYVLRVTALRPN